MNEIALWTGLPGSGRFTATAEEAVKTMRNGGVTWWVVDSMRRGERVESGLLQHTQSPVVGVDVITAGGLARYMLRASGLEPQALDSDTRVLLLREITATLDIPELGGEAAGSGWIQRVLELHQRIMDGEQILDRLERLHPWIGKTLEQYHKTLDKHGLLDETILPLTAIAEVQASTFRPPDLLIIDRLGPLRDKVVSLIHTLANRSGKTIVMLDWTESPGPALDLMTHELNTWKKHPSHTVRAFSINPTQAVLVNTLFNAVGSRTARDDQNDETEGTGLHPIGWQTHRNAREEVEDTAKRLAYLVRDEGIPDEDIAVVATDLTTYASLIETVFPLYGLTPDLRLGPPLSDSPIAQLAVQLFEGRSEGWPREAVTAVLLNPCVRFGKTLRDNAAVLELDSFARDARIVGSRGSFCETWLEPLTDQIVWLAKSAQDTQSEHRRMAILRKRDRLQRILPELEELGGMLEALPDPCDADTATDWIKDLLAQLGVNAWEHRENGNTGNENAALKFVWLTLERVKETLYLSGQKSWPVSRFAEQFAFAARQQRLRPDNRTRGGIPVTGPLEVRGLRVKYLFFLGMSDDLWPRNPVTDPLDPFAPVWGDKVNRLAESRALTWEALYAAEHLVFSAPCPDTDEGDTTPSPLIRDLQATGIQFVSTPAPDVFYSITNTLTAIGEDLGKDDLRERGLRRLSAARTWLPESDTSLEWAHGTVDRVYVDRLRDDPRILSEFNGLLENSPAGDLLARRILSNPFSVTRLDAYAACPMRFLFGNILHIDPLEEVEDEADETGLGTLVHDILAETAKRMKAEDGLSRSFGEFHAETARIMHEITNEMTADLPYDNLFWDNKLRAILSGLSNEDDPPGILRLVVNKEMSKGISGERIVFTEALFGEPQPDFDGEILLDQPLECSDGERHATVQGRIDRVSLHPKSGWRIWDYKVSNAPQKTGGAVRRGISFQLPIYLEVLLRYLQDHESYSRETERGAFYQIRPRDGSVGETGKWTKDEHMAFRDSLIANVLAIQGAIQAERFHHPLDQNNDLCSAGEFNFCPYKHVCRKDHNLFAMRQEHLKKDYLNGVYILEGQRFASLEEQP